MIPLQYEIGYAVETVAQKILPDLQAEYPAIAGINYMFGKPTEVNATLLSWSQSELRTEKYPLVALFEPFTRVTDNSNEYPKVSLHMIIAVDSQADWTSKDRQINSFEPVLIPIYEALMQELSKRPYFICLKSWRDIPHRYTEYKGGKFFTDIGLIDVIEIDNLELRINTNYRYKTKK